MSYQPNPIIPESMPMGLSPIYSTAHVNQPIDLYSGGLGLQQGTRRLPGRGAVTWEWLPRPQVQFSLHTNDWSEHTPDVQRDGSLSLSRFAVDVPVSIGSYHISNNGLSDVIGPVRAAEIGDGKSVKRILFHVANFRDYHGLPIRNECGNETWSGRTILEAGGWRITLDKIRDSKPVFDALNAVGGYAITHVGTLEKLTGRTFSARTSTRVFAPLSRYLSFCRGAWVAPMLPIGFDRHDERVWEGWHAWKIEPWRRTGTWFDDHSERGLSNGFPGFYQKWQDPIWHEPISLSLHWYVEANMCSGGVEGSIILAQAAFEMLAWTVLVEDQCLMNERAFKSKEFPAMEKLRRLLSLHGLSSSIPTSLRRLRAAAKKHQWKDGPQALTEIRNALVHSSPKKRRKVFDENPMLRIEAWKLSLWFLELILLKIFGYSGQYSKRVSSARWSGDEVEAV